MNASRKQAFAIQTFIVIKPIIAAILCGIYAFQSQANAGIALIALHGKLVMQAKKCAFRCLANATFQQIAAHGSFVMKQTIHAKSAKAFVKMI
jgi:uncharacterized protein (DUF2345 family)